MSDQPRTRRTDTDDDRRDEQAVRSIPLDTEDGGTVVIEQQNMSGRRQVGGGEFKNTEGRTIDEAAAEQDALERESPIDSDAPGRAALQPLDEQPDVEPNEPA